MYQNENTQRASDEIDEYLEKGYSYSEILDFLRDGEALAAAGLTDESLVNEMFALCEERMNLEEIANESD